MWYVSIYIDYIKCRRKGFKRISIKLLNGLVGQIGPATIGLSFKSDGSVMCTYSFCCSLIAF